MKEFLLVTNNRKVKEKYDTTFPMILSELGYIYALYDARDKIYEGYKLLSHPLCGSLKPNQTPYKSILLGTQLDKLDFDSVQLIESAIESTLKFMNCRSTPEWPENYLEDFMTVDLSIIESAVQRCDVVLKE